VEQFVWLELQLKRCIRSGYVSFDLIGVEAGNSVIVADERLLFKPSCSRRSLKASGR
jgi:hypothetical protein